MRYTKLQFAEHGKEEVKVISVGGNRYLSSSDSSEISCLQVSVQLPPDFKKVFVIKTVIIKSQELARLHMPLVLL